MLYDELTGMESGFLILTAYLENNDKILRAQELEEECEKEIKMIQQQIVEFMKSGKTEEHDQPKRNELIRILRRKFDVKNKGTTLYKP